MKNFIKSHEKRTIRNLILGPSGPNFALTLRNLELGPKMVSENPANKAQFSPKLGPIWRNVTREAPFK